MRLSRIAPSIAVLLAGCPNEQPPVAPVPSASAPVATVIPSGSASAPLPASNPTHALSVAIDGLERRIDIHPIKGGVIVLSSGFAATIQGDVITPQPLWIRNSPEPFARGPWRVGGSLGGALFLAMVEDESVVRWATRAYRLRGDTWSPITPKPLPFGPVPTSIDVWPDGRVIVLGIDVKKQRASFDVLDGDKTAELPDLALLPMGSVVTASGSFIAFGTTWESPGHELVIEPRAAGQTKGPRYALPLSQGEHAKSITGAASSKRTLLGVTTVKDGKVSARLVTFDKDTWVSKSTPIDREMFGVSLAEDDTLCVWGKTSKNMDDEGEVWCGPNEDSLVRWAPPQTRMLPRHVWARGANDIWVSAELPPSGGRATPNVLYHSRPHAAPIHADMASDKPRDQSAFRPPIPAGPRCVTPFVLIFPLTKAVPGDYDFPSTRAALKGHDEFSGVTLVEASERDKRYFGAVAPSYDVAEALRKLVAAKVAGAKPEVVCREPATWRTITIDWMTGDVIKK